MIRLDDVKKVYSTDRIETLALQNINLQVEKGEFISIMAPSGCGKSTLLNIIGLLDAPSDGKLHIDGQTINGQGDRKLARMRNEKLGFVFQSFHLVPDLKVIDNVEIPLLYRRISGAERTRLALEALDRVGLGSRAHHFPRQLSGGQQQLVAIARAVAGKPEILLADEPTGNLDSHMGEEVMQMLEGLNAAATTIVMVTHDPRMAERTHRRVRLFAGRQVN